MFRLKPKANIKSDYLPGMNFGRTRMRYYAVDQTAIANDLRWPFRKDIVEIRGCLCKFRCLLVLSVLFSTSIRLSEIERAIEYGRKLLDPM